ncbi:MAG: methyltransferase [Candidatus Aminicenantes bacterium]|jgi:tRNA1(Val) A37 N6-methylase TrmN6
MDRNRIKAEDETLDTFYHGRIKVLQKSRGYRFAVNAPLLADFIRTDKNAELLELGTGNGIISLLLSVKPFKHITAVEIQPSLAHLARRNVQLNRLENRIDVIEADLLTFQPGKKYDVIFSNPPYHRRGKGHLSRSEEISIAKHELKCTIFDIMQKTSSLLKREGRAYFVFPEKRREDLLKAAGLNGLYIKLKRFVCPRAGEKPSLFLIACDFVSEEMLVLPDLILYDKEGRYTSEAKEIFAGRLHAPTS